MAKKTVLDAEARALHESWDDVIRVALVVLVVAGAIWALCAALKKLVHYAGDSLLEYVARGGSSSVLLLLGALAAAGLIRGVLHRRAHWREVERDGIDVALRNYHSTYKDDVDDPAPRLKMPAFSLAGRKAGATLLTLGSGGSGGLEGPVVLIGEALGAGIARVMASRSEHELRTYQLAGIAAAVTTLLNTPFAAALFAIEVVYGDRIIYRKLAYCLLAGTATYVLNNHLLGTMEPIFVAPAHARTYSLREYAVSALVAVAVSAPVALGFGLAMKHTKALADRIPPIARGAVGGLLTGGVALGLAALLGVDVRHVLGMGDWTLRQLLVEAPSAELSTWWFLVLLLVAKTVTTGLTVHSGGSAGLLIPSMMLGGVGGAATARLLQTAGVLDGTDVSIFIIVGVASALVAMVGVPLAAIALVLEVFGPQFGPPAILACGLTYVLTLRLSVYDEQRSSPNPVADEIGALTDRAA